MPQSRHVGLIALETHLLPACRPRIGGAVLADHVKNLDWQVRRAVFEAKAPVEIVTDVRERLRVLLGL